MDELCTVSPSSVVPMAQPPAGSSSGVTSYGPSGVECSNVLPCRNCLVRFWKSRTLTSFSTV